MTQERRHKKRTRGHIRVDYGETQVCISDLTEDLSSTGVFVRTPYPLELGTPLQIEIQWKGTGKKFSVLQLKGEVKRVQNSVEAPGMGIEFVDLKDSDRQTLESIIAQVPSQEI